MVGPELQRGIMIASQIASGTAQIVMGMTAEAMREQQVDPEEAMKSPLAYLAGHILATTRLDPESRVFR